MSDAAFTVGWLWAGSADNVIPDRAEAGGTLRVLQPDARDSLLEATREVIEHTARAHGCTARVQVTGMAALPWVQRLAERARRALLELDDPVAPRAAPDEERHRF